MAERLSVDAVLDQCNQCIMNQLVGTLGRSLRSDEGVFLSASCNKLIAGFDLVSLSH